MFDIVGFIKAIVTTYLTDEQFIHSSEDIANIDFDKTTVDVVYLERPFEFKIEITESTILRNTYTLDLFFLSSNQYRDAGGDEINEYQEAIDTNNIAPAGTNMSTFLTNLYNNANVEGVQVVTAVDVTDSPVFDANVSGYYMKVQFTIINAGNLCQ